MAISNQGMMLVLPLYALHITGDPAYAALIVGLRGIGVLLLDIPAGMIAARFGDKNVMLGGLLCNAAVLLGLAIWTDPWVVALLSLVQGGGAAAWFLSRQSYLSDASPASTWGRSIAVVAGLNRIGAFAGPLAGGAVAEWFGYAPTFVGAGALSGLAAFVVLVRARALRPEVAPDALRASLIWRIVNDCGRVFATAGFVAFAIQLMRAARQLLVPLFGTLVGLDAAAIGFVYSISAVLDMSLSYPAGIVMDRWGRRWTGIPCMAVFILGLGLLPLAQGFYSLLSAALVLGFGNGISTGIVMVMGMDLAPPERRNQFLGVWRLISDVGGVGGPMIAGLLTGAASLALASYAVAGIGAAAAVVFLFLVPETQPVEIDLE
ncbi:MAG: MFS transporter [Gammaproteobacteria bacterium]|nr:MFS transporter [Gammaproteobacteria bacterium]MDH3505639.1 MFS transporter [Gammaproteobacteria bacterium]